MEGYLISQGGILLPLHGPQEPRKPTPVNVPIRNGEVNPDGAIIMMADTIGVTKEIAEQIYRERGFDPTFVEACPKPKPPSRPQQ